MLQYVAIIILKLNSVFSQSYNYSPQINCECHDIWQEFLHMLVGIIIWLVNFEH